MFPFVTLIVFFFLYSYPQTDCFVVSQLFSVARQTGRFKLGLKPSQLYVKLSIIQHGHQSTYVSSGIIRHYVGAFVCLHFTLTHIYIYIYIYTFYLNVYIYIYIYIYSSTLAKN